VSAPLPLARIRAGSLLQHVSRTDYRGQSLFYGRDGVNRYDAPDGGYGVLYLGRDLPTALMEAVFHQHRWSAARQRSIALAQIQRRLVRAVGVLQTLRLANLTAPGVMAGDFGLNLQQLASRHYARTQQLSARIHAQVGKDGPLFDGVLYPSRNNYPGVGVALFDRADKKIRVIDDIDLADHKGWPPFVARYRIAVI
jgi:hypothetical protein